MDPSLVSDSSDLSCHFSDSLDSSLANLRNSSNKFSSNQLKTKLDNRKSNPKLVDLDTSSIANLATSLKLSSSKPHSKSSESLHNRVPKNTLELSYFNDSVSSGIGTFHPLGNSTQISHFHDSSVDRGIMSYEPKVIKMRIPVGSPIQLRKLKIDISPPTLIETGIKIFSMDPESGLEIDLKKDSELVPPKFRGYSNLDIVMQATKEGVFHVGFLIFSKCGGYSCKVNLNVEANAVGSFGTLRR